MKGFERHWVDRLVGWGTGAAIPLACVLGFWLVLSAHPAGMRTLESPGVVRPGTPVPRPAPVLEPLPVRATPARPGSTTSVYECRQDGARWYSVRPCGPDGVRREVPTEQLDLYTPPAVELRSR